MLSWQVYIAISIVLYATSSVLNKFVARDRPGEFSAFSLQLAGSLALLPFVKTFPSGQVLWGWTLFASFLYGISSVLFLDAYTKGTVSVLVPLSNFQPVFVLLIAAAFLNESFTLQKAIGIALIVWGAAHLKRAHSLITSAKALAREKSTRLYMVAMFFFAIARVIDKMVIGSFDTVSYAFVQWFVPSLIVASYVFLRNESSRFFRFLKERYPLVIATGIVSVTAYFFFILSIRQAEVSKVMPLSSFSTLLSVVMAHYVLKEKMDGRPVAAAVMVAGAALIVMTPMF